MHKVALSLRPSLLTFMAALLISLKNRSPTAGLLHSSQNRYFMTYIQFWRPLSGQARSLRVRSRSSHEAIILFFHRELITCCHRQVTCYPYPLLSAYLKVECAKQGHSSLGSPIQLPTGRLAMIKALLAEYRTLALQKLSRTELRATAVRVHEPRHHAARRQTLEFRPAQHINSIQK